MEKNLCKEKVQKLKNELRGCIQEMREKPIKIITESARIGTSKKIKRTCGKDWFNEE